MSHFGYFAYHLHQLELVLWHFNSWKQQAADPTFQSDPEEKPGHGLGYFLEESAFISYVFIAVVV